jgi:hypothetical protein
MRLLAADTELAAPFHWITDPDLNPALFFSGFRDANKKFFI